MQDHSTLTPYFPENLQDYALWVAKHGLFAPYGECQCGCGKTTALAHQTDNIYRGVLKGQPARFVRGHTLRTERTSPHELPPTESDTICYIPLTKGMFAMVDAADYEWLMQWVWRSEKQTRHYYAVRYGSKGRAVRMHRAILEMDSHLFVDHRDGNGLNNTRANLRVATVLENNRNSFRTPTNAYGYKGISLTRCGKWHAQIQVDGKKIRLGYYATAAEAALAYDNAARSAFGEFARTNFQEDGHVNLPE